MDPILSTLGGRIYSKCRDLSALVPLATARLLC